MYSIYPMKSQRGLGLVGFMLFTAAVILAVIFTVRLVPVYVEFFTLKKVLATMGQDSKIRSNSDAEIRRDFSRRASVDGIDAVSPDDLTIDRSGDVPVITAEYEYRTTFIGNTSLVASFRTSTDPAKAPAQIE